MKEFNMKEKIEKAVEVFLRDRWCDSDEISFGHYYSVLNDNEKLRKELEQEKAAHTETKARVIFATHILNGNRQEATNDFMKEYDKQIKSLVNENAKLLKEIEDYKKSVNSWKTKFEQSKEKWYN